MKKGPIITGIVATLAMIGVVAAFLTSASPYGTFADAKQKEGAVYHIPGDLVKESLHTDVGSQTVRFNLTDENGETMKVVYNGPPPANMGEATKVVAIGSVQSNEFHSDKLLIKCPSKYEGEQGESGEKQAKL